MSRTSNIIVNTKNNTSSANNKLTAKFPQTYFSDGDTIALANVNIYYSWFNVTSQFSNKTMSYYFNGTNYPVTFPDGFYSVADLNGYLQSVMKTNGHYLLDSNGEYVFFLALVLNPVYYAVTLTATPVPSSLPSGYSNPRTISLSGFTPQLITDSSEWSSLIGFAKNTSFPSSSTTTVIYQINSSLTPKISPVTSVNVACSWVSDTRFSRFPSILATFIPSDTTSFGGLISYQPPVLLQYPVNRNYYSEISIEFLDQDYRPLVLNDTSQISVSLILSSKK